MTKINMKRKHIVTLILTCLLFSVCNNKYMLKNIEGKRIDEKVFNGC